MRHAKSGEWWNNDPQRALANNSAVYAEKPGIGIFMEEWQALYNSKSGERGIFNREAARKAAELCGRDASQVVGTNPCGEISLRDKGFCNLSSIMVQPNDTLDDLLAKAEIAAILGTWQSTVTNFVYLSPKWKQNADEERLLGVSMTGCLDHPVLSHTTAKAAEWLNAMRDRVREVNAREAARFGIPAAAASCCVKPEGTVSQLTDTASGLHPRYAPYYIRRVRADGKDPLANVMREQGFPCEVDVMQPSNLVFSFPIKAPEHAVFRDDRTALEQLEYWMMMRKEWCDGHNPSVTIYVKEHEWLEVGAWVYENFDDVCGISFLPHSDHTYQQAPYTECTQEEYETSVAAMPTYIDYDALGRLETEDHTTGTQTLACTAGGCDI
jgi:ribonucleoside-diphosphate reductase alpha chain